MHNVIMPSVKDHPGAHGSRNRWPRKRVPLSREHWRSEETHGRRCDIFHVSDRAHRRTWHPQRAMIAGRLALTVAAIAAAGTAWPGASTTQLYAVALSYQLAAKSTVINQPDPETAQRLAAGAWSVFPGSQIDSVMATLLTEQQQKGALLASSSGVNGVAFSSDGSLLASAYGDGTVRLWDLTTDKLYGSVLRAGSGSQGGVNGVAFSPDGSLLASADTDGTVRMWHPASGQPAGPPLQAGSSVNGVAFSPDGSLLASADTDGIIQRWHPATGQPAGPPLQAGSSVNGVAFSPDSSLLASANANSVIQVWNSATGQPSADSGDWFIILASVIAIALSGLAVTITVRAMRLASRGPR
jgi:WD40 repeat protein